MSGYMLIKNVHINTSPAAQDVPLLMIGLKLRRQAYQHKDDNWVDIHGYALCAEWMETGIKPE